MLFSKNYYFKILFGISIIFIILFTITSAYATDIFVDMYGDDVNGDGSTNNPFNTISCAVNKTNSGDTIILNPGEYSGKNNAGIYISNKTLSIISFNNTNPSIINGKNIEDSIITCEKSLMLF